MIKARHTDDGHIYPLDDPHFDLPAAARAGLELDWRFGMNITRALSLCLQRHGYKDVAVPYGRVIGAILDIVVKRHNTPHTSLDGIRAVLAETKAPVVETAIARVFEHGLIVERDDKTLIPTALGATIWQILPADLRSTSEVGRIEAALDGIDRGSWRAEDFLQHELAKLPTYIQLILDAKIGLEPKGATACPSCGGIARRLRSKKAGWFWRCQDSACDAWFPDAGGQLVRPVTCGACGKTKLSRFESKKKPGVFFHRCAACDGFFNDDNGKPGAAFGDEETTRCHICGMQATRRQSDKIKGMWYWRCQGDCGNFRDTDGKPGEPFTEIGDWLFVAWHAHSAADLAQVFQRGGMSGIDAADAVQRLEDQGFIEIDCNREDGPYTFTEAGMRALSLGI